MIYAIIRRQLNHPLFLQGLSLKKDPLLECIFVIK